MRATYRRKNGCANSGLPIWPLVAVSMLVLACFFTAAVGYDVPRVSAAPVNAGPAAPGPRPAHRAPAAVDGLPAIAPRAGTQAGKAAFSEQDAAQYASGHRMWHNMDGSRPTVVAVRFATSQEISALVHTTTGRPADALLCYVELKGTFTFPGPNQDVTYHTGFEVFDAQTGNMLVAGGMP